MQLLHAIAYLLLHLWHKGKNMDFPIHHECYIEKSGIIKQEIIVAYDVVKRYDKNIDELFLLLENKHRKIDKKKTRRLIAELEVLLGLRNQLILDFNLEQRWEYNPPK